MIVAANNYTSFNALLKSKLKKKKNITTYITYFFMGIECFIVCELGRKPLSSLRVPKNGANIKKQSNDKC